MVKQALKRKRPQFNETAQGYRTFSDLLRDADKRGLLRIEKSQGSGGYRITGVVAGD